MTVCILLCDCIQRRSCLYTWYTCVMQSPKTIHMYIIYFQICQRSQAKHAD